MSRATFNLFLFAEVAATKPLEPAPIGEGYEPSSPGTLVYLNGGDDLTILLSKVEVSGGKIILPKTAIGPNDFMARFTDPEGI